MSIAKYKPSFTGFGRNETKWAKKRFQSYVDSYEIDTFSDLQVLEELVFVETLNERTKKQLNLLRVNNQGSVEHEKIPAEMRKSISTNLDTIVKLKDKLKLFREKEELEKIDPYEDFKVLEKKFKVWRNENQATRQCVCQHCGKMTMLKIKTDVWESQKHPFFKDRILFNEHLIKLYLEGTITKEDVGKIFETSQFYANWLVDKAWVTNPKHKEIKEEIDKEKTK